MARFNIKNFDVNKNYVLEASAGTGKTYSIILILEKLLKEVKDLTLDQILIVTYTEKAAGELKNRVRKKKLDPQRVDNAPIFTFHSFCQSVIQEFGYSAKLPFALSLIDDSYLIAFLNQYIHQGEILKEISILMSDRLSVKEDEMISLFASAINKYYLDYDNNEVSEVINIYSQNFKDVNEKMQLYFDYRSSKTIDEFFNKNDKLRDALITLENSSKKKGQELVNILRGNKFEQPLNYDGMQFKANYCAVTEEEKEAFNYIKDNKDLGTDKFKAPVSTYLVYKYLKDAYIKWNKEKERNKAENFNDMIRSVRESVLHNEAFKKKIQSKYKYAIIDEFQDTSQLQFDIFSTLFINPEHHIIVVGDPKQSIYSFQGADINVYSKAKKAILENNNPIGVQEDLFKNYRSSKSIVESCNKLFQKYHFKDTIFIDSEYCSLASGNSNEYHAKYRGEEVDGFWIAMQDNMQEIDEYEFAKIAVETIIDCCSKDEEGHTNLRITYKKEDKDELDENSSQNSKTEENMPLLRDISFKDFVILVRKRSEIPPIAKALNNAGIPYIKYKDTALFKSNECLNLITLLEAINVSDFTGHNRNLFKRALFTDFFGYDIKDIGDDIFNSDSSDEIIDINNWKKLASEKSYQQMFDEMVSLHLENRLVRINDMQSLGKYKQLGEYCIDYLSNSHTLMQLIDNLTYLYNGGSLDEDDENNGTVKKSTDFNSVRIMTFHASKGLQFPIVIAAGGYRGKENKSIGAFTFHDEYNKHYLTLDKSNITFIDEEAEAEFKRLVYVAYTRAENVMILPNYKKTTHNFIKSTLKEYMSEGGKYRELIYKNIDIKKLNKLVKDILNKDNFTDEGKSEQLSNLKKTLSYKYNKGSKKHSYSTLSHPKNEEVILDEIKEDKENESSGGLANFDNRGLSYFGLLDENISPITLSSNFPKGAFIGTALHEIFEISDYIRIAKYENELKNNVIRCFKNNDIATKEEWINDAIKMTQNVLNAKLPVIHGSKKIEDEYFILKNIENKDKQAEVEFNFNLYDERLKNYLNGFVDLIFRQGDRYSIIDWKSDALNDEFISYAKKEELIKHVNDRYAIQRCLYSYTLINWLKQFYPTESLEDIFINHFGGIYYIFLRGANGGYSNGIYAKTWSTYQELEESYLEILKEKIGGKKNG